MALGGFLVSGVESLGEFFRLASELHDVLGSLFQVLKRRPGFVPHRSDAQAGEQGFLCVFPGCIFIQTGEDAGVSRADEELRPCDFIGIFPDLSELEPLVKLCQPVGQDVLAVIVFRHCVYDGIHFYFWKDTTGCTMY